MRFYLTIYIARCVPSLGRMAEKNGIGIKMAGYFYIEGKTEELLRRDKNAQKTNMCNQCVINAHRCTNMCNKLCKKIVQGNHLPCTQERREGGNKQKMSGIQHGEREMEEKDELTFIRKRNRSVQVFDEWKRKNEEECEKLAQQLLNKESREHDKQCAI